MAAMKTFEVGATPVQLDIGPQNMCGEIFEKCGTTLR
jgi:hypothetical protein